MKTPAEKIRYLDKFTARKVQDDNRQLLASLPDSLGAWITQYLHLARFLEYFQRAYGHDRISTCLKRDVISWQKQMKADGLAHSTINNHLASLSSFCTWVYSHSPTALCCGRSH